MSLLLLIKKKFNPRNWFAKGEQGAWYDPSDFLPNWRRNLLTYSQRIGGTNWSAINNGTLNGTNYTAPDGTLTASLITSTGADCYLIQNNSFTTGIPYTFSVYLRADANVSISFGIGVTFTTAPITTTWQRFTFTMNAVAGMQQRIIIGGINSWASGTSVYLWGAQLDKSSSATAYQKITDGIQDYYTYQPQPVLFQDSAGVTPVTALEQPVGLMLDKSKGLALGAELVTNGDFSNGSTGWSLDAGWSVAGGLVNGTAVSPGYGIGTTIAGAINTWYKITITVSNYVSGSVATTLYNGDNGPAYSANGTYVSYIQKKSLSTNIAGVYAATAFTGSVDNISVRQIAGNHAFQATNANRPILSARVNLLTKTEDFSDATVWVKNAGTSAVGGFLDPNGTSNAYTVTASLNGYIGQTTTVALGNNTLTFTYSIYLKAGTVTSCRATIYSQTGGANTYVEVDLTTGNKSSGGSWTNTPTVSYVGDGWYKVSFITTPTASASNGNAGIVVYNMNNAGTFQVWHPDLRPTNSGALLPPYQRVNTASDYDSVGFPLYLKANGTSSAMSTNSIDFSGTDKMTVVTGVRKLSDALAGIFMELSVDRTANNGTFGYLVPRSLSANEPLFSSKGTILVNAGNIANYQAAPVSWVLSGQSSISTPSVLSRINSLDYVSSTDSQGSGTYGNYPLYLFARTSVSYFNGQFYGAIIRGAQSDQNSIVKAEKLMATKTGITF